MGAASALSTRADYKDKVLGAHACALPAPYVQFLSQPFSICCSTSFCTVSAGANHVDANQLGRPILKTTESTFSKKRENLRRKESEDSKDSDKSGQLGTEVVGAAAALLLKLN